MKTLSALFFYSPLVLCLSCLCLNSQDLSSLPTKKFKFSGGLQYGIVLQKNTNSSISTNPFFWNFSANFNLSLLNILNMPFTFTANSQNTEFNKPAFTRFGISPRYKNLTLHLGHRALSLSEYSLAGAMFKGIAAEYRILSKKIDVTALYADFSSQLDFSAQSVNTLNSTDYYQNREFGRIGFGGKIGKQSKNGKMNFIFFNFKDFAKQDSTENHRLFLQENVLSSIEIERKISEKISLYTNLFFSFFPKTAINETEQLFQDSYSEQHAKKSSGRQIKLKINLKRQQVAINHLYIKPDYLSLGAPFLQNDINQWSVSNNLNLFKSTVSFRLNVGIMQNNLDGKQQNTSKRFISSVQSGIRISKRLQLSLMYSNFSITSLPVRIEFTDSIRYLQVTENATFSTNYSFRTEKIQQSFTFAAQYQAVKQMQQNNEANPDNKLINFSANHNIKIKAAEISFSTSLNFNISKENLCLPSLKISKKLPKNLGEFGSSFLLILNNNRPGSQNIAINYSNSLFDKLLINMTYQLINMKENKIMGFSSQISYSF